MKRPLKRALLVLGAALVSLLGAMTVRALTVPSRQLAVEPATDLSIDEGAAAERLAQAIRFPTVSHQERDKLDPGPFLDLRAHLEQAFPRAHKALKREIVDEYSLLYTWQGTDPSLRPAVLMGHMDVVPADPEIQSKWTEPPFSGNIKDGFVWGRGTLDDKVAVMGTLEAVEWLLAHGHAPKRTIYLAYGHDEEVLGHGAKAIAELLASRGVRPEYVIDEGMLITQGMTPGVSAPVALIGVAQKGYLSLELTTSATGGHSSMPPEHTAVGILSAAVARLEEHPMPATLSGPTREMLETLAPEATFAMRLVFANLWLSRPIVEQILLQKPATAALLRTTTAPTMLQAGVKENVLAQSAKAIINFRIRPGDSVASVTDYVEATIADPRVEVKALSAGTEPSRPSPTDSPRFSTVARALRRVDPLVLVAPALVIGATDARHYQGMSDDIYLFLPVAVRGDDLQRIHGVDERVALGDYARTIRFFVELIRASD